jgi:hypothetical protein
MRTQRESRQSARPDRNDALIASVIPSPLSLRNVDGAPALALPQSAHPAVARVSQLIGDRIPRVVSATGHGYQKRSAVVAVVSGQEPPSVKPRTSDDLVSVFSEIQSQDAQNRSLFLFLVTMCSDNVYAVEQGKQKPQK